MYVFCEYVCKRLCVSSVMFVCECIQKSICLYFEQWVVFAFANERVKEL